MNTRYMLGNEVIAHACLEAEIDFASGYPGGTPSSEVIDYLRHQKDRDFYVEWSVNEKVAFENALAAAWTGIRSLVTMKHVGLNVAADPLLTSAYTGVTGGFVILSADDPYAHSSQNEQDSRRYALFAKIPCLDPATVQEAHSMMKAAFAVSEEVGLPVLFRPTTRICHSKSDVEPGDIGTGHRTGEFVRNPQQYVVIPVHTRMLHKKLNDKQAGLAKMFVEGGFNTAEVRGTTAVITGGIAAAYAEELVPEGVSFAKIGAYPIDPPEWLKTFVDQHETVLVIEELSPVIEEAVRMAATTTLVHGKMDGHLPLEGELSPPAAVAEAMVSAGFTPTKTYPVVAPEAGIPARPPLLCAGCGHRAVFYAMKKVFRDGIFPSDIGCYTLGIQLGTVDTTICMGGRPLRSAAVSRSPVRADRWSAPSVTRPFCTPAFRVF